MAEPKRDCYAYRIITKKGIMLEKCDCMRELYCKHEKCKAYKPKGTECDTCEYKKLKSPEICNIPGFECPLYSK